MAFDIYAGTFTRFYTREWENVVQRQSRLESTNYMMIFAGGEEAPPPASEVRRTVDAWQAGINAALAQHKLGPVEWSDTDEQPYFTDRPGWEGYSALQLWAAYAEQPEETPPYALPGSWAENKVWQSVVEKPDDIHFRTILQATVWLPGDFEFSFKFPGLTEDEVMIASTTGLRNQLRELADRPLRWQSKPVLDRLRRREEVSFQEAAEWGRSSFLAVAEQAVAAHVPFMLSF